MAIRTGILASAVFTSLLVIPTISMAETTLVFDVDTTIYSLDTNGNWNAGGSSAFQFTLAYDDSQFTHTNQPPAGLESITQSYQELSAPITSYAGESASAVAPYTQSADLSPNAVRNSQAAYYQGNVFGSDNNQLLFRSNISEQHSVGLPYIGTAGLEEQQTYQYSEGFTIGYLGNTLLPADPLTSNDFLSYVQGFVGADGAFAFTQVASELTDICATALNICKGANGSGYLSANGIKYSGTATLVSVSSVPLPPAAWLFGSAVTALLGLRFRKKV